MKILCISDQIDPLVYSNTIKERFGDVDIVLAAGDLPMDYLDFIVSSLNKPMLFVFGNHHAEELRYYRKRESPSFNSSDGMEDIHEIRGSGASHIGSRIKIQDGLIFMGLGGSIRYNSGENQYSDFQMYLEIIKKLPRLLFNRVFRGRYLDILLTHASPKGIHDKEDRCHQGFKAFIWFMKVFRPAYLIHGHIHLYDLRDIRVTKFQDTMIINAFSHYVIDTEEGKL
ncbi:MAG: metallophosphoesterase [Treponema sp.]|jgi:Icc-related predicted phosphoesterase|nr:metallophosphoesterase [Treponema sp.]